MSVWELTLLFNINLTFLVLHFLHHRRRSSGITTVQVAKSLQILTGIVDYFLEQSIQKEKFPLNICILEELTTDRKHMGFVVCLLTIVLKKKWINLPTSPQGDTCWIPLVLLYFLDSTFFRWSRVHIHKKGTRILMFCQKYQGRALGMSCCMCKVFSAIVLFTTHLFTI